MSKYEFYSLRDDELTQIQEIIKAQPELEVSLHQEPLTLETLELMGDDCEAVIVCENHKIEDGLFTRLAERGVKVLSTRSAGFDLYMGEEFKASGLRLTNVARYSPESIAEYCMTGALYFMRKLPTVLTRTRAHNFSWQEELLTKRFAEFTVGIIGAGRIGVAFARLMKGLGCTIIAHDPYYENPDLVDEGLLTYTSLDELCAKAEVISIHAPASDRDFHLISKQQFDLMQPGTIVINAARGILLDTDALLEAIEAGTVYGAWLDVYEGEHAYVPQDCSEQVVLADERLQKLIDHEQVVYSPHIAFYTTEAVKALVNGGLTGAREILETGESSFEVKLQ